MIQIDIDMPKRCEECPFCLDLDCILYERVTNEYYDTTYEQYAHCPLKDVTDINVGDTISRRAAVEALYDWEMCYDWDEHCREEDPKPAYIVSPSDVIEKLPSAQPNLDEWCTDCKEYDHEKHCCPRFNRVIRDALNEVEPTRKKGGEDA